MWWRHVHIYNIFWKQHIYIYIYILPRAHYWRRDLDFCITSSIITIRENNNLVQKQMELLSAIPFCDELTPVPSENTSNSNLYNKNQSKITQFLKSHRIVKYWTIKIMKTSKNVTPILTRLLTFACKSNTFWSMFRFALPPCLAEIVEMWIKNNRKKHQLRRNWSSFFL